MNMNVTLRLKLSCFPEASKALKETISQYTSAFNRATQTGFDNHLTNGIRIHALNYDKERAQTQLPSQLVCSLFSKAGEALKARWQLQKKRDLKIKGMESKGLPVKPWLRRPFKCPQSKRQAIRYDGKRASMVRLKEGWATLASVSGRQEVKFKLPPNFNRYAEWKVCVSELVWDKRDRLFLHVVLDGQGNPFVPNGLVVGVDLGIKRPAVMSSGDGKFNQFLGEKRWADMERRMYSHRRTLQRKGTKPARRKLKKLGRKVNRFREGCDHVLSRRIVDSVPAGTVLVLENLKDIRERCGTNKGRRQDERMHRWSFDRLFFMVAYKATMKGVKVEKVDPRNTSRRCSKCGDVRKSNRKDQSHFECKSCHATLNADLNGARNIALKFSIAGMPAMDGCLSTSPMSPDS
jgi:IS605 OrfB family transposase